MENSVVISVLERGKTVRRIISQCVSIYFSKERYTPYSFFRGSFYTTESFSEIFEIEVAINGVLVHKGVIDTCEVKELSSQKLLNITSRGYSFALGYNELADGIIYDVDLNMLMTQRVSLPFVTYENPTKVASYLFVKQHTSLWDAVVNLCLKVETTQPYVAYPNMIRFTKHQNKKNILFSDSEKIISFSSGNDLSKIISEIHMKDTNDTYNTYSASTAYADDRNIVRHKYIDFDKQWLIDPVQGLGFRLNFASRGRAFKTITYSGFNGEDINDSFTVSTEEKQMAEQYISKIDIYGGKNGLVTRLTAYKDSYCNT